MPIVFQGVNFSYDGENPTLQDIDFEVRDGSLLGIAGHTGSGKSTLLQMMNALLIPTSGKVLVDGMDTAQRKLRRDIRRKVGLVFQYPEHQLFANSVAEDLAFGPLNTGKGQDLASEAGRKALHTVGLDYDVFAEKSPFDLSGGQRRRVALAGVLALEPGVLVLDEPMAGLDPRGCREMIKLLKKLNAQGITVVVISHSMDDIAAMCTDVLILNEGRIWAQGTPEEVFSRENAQGLRDINLGLPKARQFAFDLADKGVTLEGPCLTVDQLAGSIATVARAAL